MTPGVRERLKDVPRPQKPPTWIHPMFDSEKARAKMAKKIEKHERKKKEYDYAVLEAMDEEGVPLCDRPDVYVKLECELKGVHSAGPRTLVLDRLEAFNRGEKVMMNEMFAHKTIKISDLTQMLIERPPPLPIKQRVTGADGLTGVPSAVIIAHLFPFLGLKSMFRIAYTSKRMFALALPVLRKHAKHLFGEGGTPLALSCAMVLDKTDRTRVAARAKELFKLLCIPIPDRDSEKRVVMVIDDRLRAAAAANEMGDGFSVAVADVTNYVAVQLAIYKYGTIEGMDVQRAKNKAVSELQAQERAAMINQGPQRLKELNDALLAVGYPVMFDRIVPQETPQQRRERMKREKEEDKKRYGRGYKASKRLRQSIQNAKDSAETPGRDRLALTPIGMFIMNHLDVLGNGTHAVGMCQMRRIFLTKCASFVYRHSPKQTYTVITNLNDLGNSFPTFALRVSKAVPDMNLYDTNVTLAVKCTDALFGFSGPMCRTLNGMFKTPFTLTCGIDLSKNPKLDELLAWIVKNRAGEWLESEKHRYSDSSDKTTYGLYALDWCESAQPFVAIVWKSFKRMPYFEKVAKDSLGGACTIVSRVIEDDVNPSKVHTFFWGEPWTLAEILFPTSKARQFGVTMNVLLNRRLRDCTEHCTRNVLVFFVDDTKKK